MTLASAAGTFIATTPITIAKGPTAIATREAACWMPVFLVLAVMLMLVICLKWVEEVALLDLFTIAALPLLPHHPKVVS